MIIAVGSNIEPEVHVPRAIARLRAACTVHAVSPFYRTAPIGSTGQDDFWNGVVAVDDIDRETLRRIEADEDRVRTADKYTARTLDLDILEPGDLLERPFLARCLADIGALPEGTADPGHQWPVVWRPE